MLPNLSRLTEMSRCGGPLVVQTDQGGYLQVGIVGGGVQCGDPTMPGTYARIASFTDWINTTMKNN